MQPENNVQNEPSVPVNNNAGSDVVFQDKPKKNLGVILGMVFLVLLAAGGIGFGVWEMMDGNSQKEQLNEQIATLKTQNSELMDKLENNTTENIDVVIDEGTGSTINTADYIYVGEWGLKIRLPDELKKASYALYAYQSSDEKSLCVSGVAGEENGLPAFAELSANNPGLGCIGRKSKDVTGYYGKIVFSDEKYDYVYNGPQAVFSTDENEKNLEVESVRIIQQMFSDENNYSKI